MKNSLVFVFLLSLSMFSCEENENYLINNQADLEQSIPNEFLKISYNPTDLESLDCSSNSFSFDQVEVVKIKKADFEKIKESLLSARLDPMQTVVTSNLTIEFRGFKYCLNHLGELSRNSRRLQINKDLVYQISTESGFYNSFRQEELEKKDTLISTFGLPFNYRFDEEKDSVAATIREGEEKKRRNVILTY